MTDDIVERLMAKDILTSIISSAWCKTGRHPGELADLMKEAANEIEKLRREAAIRIDQIEREQEAHLRTIADYNRVAVENAKLRRAMHDIYEVYAGIDGYLFDESKAYREQKFKEMADIAAGHKI